MISQEAIEFFKEHGALSVRPGESDAEARERNARDYAEAEVAASARGWVVTWEIDQDADTTPTDNYFVSGNPQWSAILRDAEGEYLESLHGIDFAEDYSASGPESDPYARVVAAELAQEALTRFPPLPGPGITPGIDHWHVTRHSEDSDMFVTYDMYEAIAYAGDTLREASEFAHEGITASGEAGDFEGAYESFKRSEALHGLFLNALNMETQHTAAPQDRAPLYQEDNAHYTPGAPLYDSALWNIGQINEGSAVRIWPCEYTAEAAGDRAAEFGEDDPEALICTGERSRDPGSGD